jgi:transketolase (EC 2.2.1.1)
MSKIKHIKNSVLTPGVKRIAIEAGVGDGWYKYVGIDGGLVCMTTFGESAPAGDLFKEFGFTVDNVVATAKKRIRLNKELNTGLACKACVLERITSFGVIVIKSK